MFNIDWITQCDSTSFTQDYLINVRSAICAVCANESRVVEVKTFVEIISSNGLNTLQ
jgi:hypothetical protein